MDHEGGRRRAMMKTDDAKNNSNELTNLMTNGAGTLVNQ